MANISEGNANFIQGLSDLWTRFFKDQDQLRALYEGSEIIIGQAYLDLVSTVLNISVRETPLFQKEFFKLISVREDSVTYRSSDGRYLFETTDISLKSCRFLCNKIFNPSAILESGIDFEVETGGEKDYILFYKDPFDWDETGNSIPGMAYRTLSETDDEGNVSTQRELAIWIPDAVVDRFDLYLNYGYLIKRFEPSSEAYRALIQGIIRYFVLGPTSQHLVSTLNVVTGLPVVSEDGEILQRIDSTNPNYNVVVTDHNRYQFDVAITLREDVEDETNWGVLEFQAFEHLSKVFTVYDSLQNPTWWFDTLIPAKILPDESRIRRTIDPNLYENKINNPPELVKIGDPGFFVGADFDGFVPTGRPAYRHSFPFIVFERFLKHHTFTVVFDSNVLLSGAVPYPKFDFDIQQIVVAGRSAYTVLYLEPGVKVTDRLFIASDESSDLVISIIASLFETFTFSDVNLLVDEDSWKIGDYYFYDVVGITVKNESTDPIGTPFLDGKTPVVVGGSDPYWPYAEPDEGMGIIDWPVQVKTLAPIMFYTDQSAPGAFLLGMACNPGSGIVIDWGDETTSNWICDGTLHSVNHVYSSSGQYGIRITSGDILDVTEINCIVPTAYGDISALSGFINLTYLKLRFTAIIGDIASLVGMAGLQSLELNNTLLSGNLGSLSGLSSMLLLNVHKSSVAGDVASIANMINLTEVYLLGSAIDAYTSTALPAWDNTIINISNLGLSSAEVDDFLIDLANGVGVNGTLNIAGSNEARTSASDAAKATLLSAGWTVIVYE